MHDILSRLYTGNASAVMHDMIHRYQDQHFLVVDYLYFANVYGKKVFDDHHELLAREQFTDMLLDGYKKTSLSQVRVAYQHALRAADFLLPDGIALQVFYFLAYRRWLHNLNGTDFALYCLEYLVRHYGASKVRIALYGTYPHLLTKTKTFLEGNGYQVVYAQDGYTNLDWDQLSAVCSSHHEGVTVLLVARSTPVYPIQEIRSYANEERLRDLRLRVMNQAGTFDFWV